jgi:hypothetical protein
MIEDALESDLRNVDLVQIESTLLSRYNLEPEGMSSQSSHIVVALSKSTRLAFGLPVNRHAKLSKAEVQLHFEQFNGTLAFLDNLRSRLNPLDRSEIFKESPGVESDWVLIAKMDGMKIHGSELKFKNEAQEYSKKLNATVGDYLPLNDRKKYSSIFLPLPTRSDYLTDIMNFGPLAMSWWPVEDLDSILQEYFEKHWLQCKAIDVLLIQAMIYKTIRNQIGEISYRNTSRIKSIHKPAESHQERLGRKKKWDNFLSLSNKLLHATASIGVGYTFGWAVGLFVYVLLDLSFSLLSVNHRNLEEMTYRIDLSQADDANIILNLVHPSAQQATLLLPETLISRLRHCENLGSMRFPSSLYLLLDIANKRGAHQWALQV